MLEKIQSFSDGKYELSQDLSETYDAAIGDTAERIEALQIVQRQVSTGSSNPTLPCANKIAI
jgi:hypothetical protein